MITTQHKDHLVEFAVFGELTLAAFKEFEELALCAIKFAWQVNLLLDLRDIAYFTTDWVWEEVRMY